MRYRRDINGATESGERTAQCHCPGRDSRDRNPKKGAGAPPMSKRAKLESRFAVKQEDVASDREYGRKNHPGVEPAWFQVDMKLGRLRDRRALRVGARGLHQRPVDRPSEHLHRDEVEHDRADNFVDVAPSAEIPADSAPECASGRAGSENRKNGRKMRPSSEHRTDCACGQSTRYQLAVGADIPKRALERDSNRKTRKDQWRRLHERVGKREPTAERTLP